MADVEEVAVNGSGDSTTTKQTKESPKKTEKDTEPMEESTEKTDKVTEETKESAEKTEVKKDEEVKSENTEDVTELEKKIIRQIEYYFGDINLCRDKFLQEQIKLDEGWVPMETLLKFNRLKLLSKDAEEISKALKKSTLGLIELSEDGNKIRRSPDKPLPDNTTERKVELTSRSIYAKGFPLTTTLDQIDEFFKTFGAVESIQMRKSPKKEFKGSVFVIFVKTEDAEKFVKTEELSYESKVLVKCTKADYFKRKDEERQQLKLKKEEERMGNKEQNDKDKDTKESEDIENRMAKGAILHLTGFKGVTPLDDIRNFFNDYSKVQWVDFEEEKKESWVRFSEAEQATEVLKKVLEKDGKIEINGVTLEGVVLEGEAELDRWKEIFQAQADSWKRRNKGKANQPNRKRSHHFKKGGRGRDSHRHRDRSDGEPAAKSVKTD